MGTQTTSTQHNILEFQSGKCEEGALGVITPGSLGDLTNVTLTLLSLCRGNGLM